MEEIVYRKSTLNDIPALLKLEQRIIEAERPYNTILKSEGAKYYDLDHLISDLKSHLVVAQVGSNIVGTGYAQLRESNTAYTHDTHSYLGFMYVEPSQRCKGINKKIIDLLIQWSKAQGITDFYLDVYSDNSPAIRAYEKAGFKKSLTEMKLNLTT